MNIQKLRVAVICGGRSGEHEISLLSAKSIISAIDRNRYEVVVFGIYKDGSWHLMNEKDFLANPDDPAKIALKAGGEEIYITPSPSKRPFHTKDNGIEVDVVFPILHGTYGEDGTIQGMLDMLGVAYVGANYLGSAAAMDKDMSKRLFREAGLPVVKYRPLNRENYEGNINTALDEIEANFSYPVFIKPANLGSSVGTNKAKSRQELAFALHDAWQYDTKILVEEAINAREIECSLLGNEHIEASELGEIIPRHEFYSYEAKYIDPDGAKLVVGVELEPAMKKRIQEIAKKAFRALGCEGMARADFFVDKVTGEIYISELNTIPGFTNISMYPKLWEKSGISYPTLIDNLIGLALKRHEVKKILKTDYKSTG